MSIAINPFAKRQIGITAESKFGGWTGTAEDLKKTIRWLINAELLSGPVCIRRIYAEELIPLKADSAVTDFRIDAASKFICTHAVVRTGEAVETVFEARRANEQPVAVKTVRRSTRPAAATIDLVLYSHEELAKTGDDVSDGWELVSINTMPDHLAMGVNEPQTPATLWRNYLAKIPGRRGRGVL